MVLVFASLVPVFSDLALGAALVQRATLTEADRSTVFWTSAAVGLAFTLLGFGASWPIAAFYGEPEVQPLFAALSLGVRRDRALGTTQKALMHARDGLPPASSCAMMAAQPWPPPSAASRSRSRGYGAWAIIGQQLDRRGRVDGAAVVPHRLAAALHVLAREPARPVPVQRERVLHAAALLREPQRRQPADRPLPRPGGARHLRGRLQHHARAASQLSLARARRPVPGLLARSRTTRARWRRPWLPRHPR